MKDETIDKIIEWVVNHIVWVPFIVFVWFMFFYHFAGLPSALITFGDKKPVVANGSAAPEPYVFRAVEPIK
jgi:polyferredoxin